MSRAGWPDTINMYCSSMLVTSLDLGSCSDHALPRVVLKLHGLDRTNAYCTLSDKEAKDSLNPLRSCAPKASHGLAREAYLRAPATSKATCRCSSQTVCSWLSAEHSRLIGLCL